MIVVAWTAVAALGAAVSAVSAVDAWRDLHVLDMTGNGRHAIARGELRRELIRFGIQAIWTSIGLMALTQGTGSELTLAVALLMATNALVALNSVLDLRDRITWRQRYG